MEADIIQDSLLSIKTEIWGYTKHKLSKKKTVDVLFYSLNVCENPNFV